MGKQSRGKDERRAAVKLTELRSEMGHSGLRFGVGIEPGASQPILLHFKVGDKTVLPTCWDVASARAMAKSLNKYCDLHEAEKETAFPKSSSI